MCQLQSDRNRVIFRIVKNDKYQEDVDEKSLLTEAADRLGTDIQIAFEYMEVIPKTTAVKLKFVISEIK